MQFKNELIGDIVNIEISADMPVSTLYALETIFYLRLQLAQVGWAADEPIYEAFCHNRFEQLLEALTKKYAAATSVGEMASILCRIEAISQTLNLGNSHFALQEREELLTLPNLTYAQRYRLENLLDINSADLRGDIDRLLPEAKTSFDIATLFDIDTFGTDTQRAAVMDLYAAMLGEAIAEANAPEAANLLAAAAYCNSDPYRRARIADLTRGAVLPGIPLPALRVNAIAASIYAQIDKITGKYEIPA